AYAGEKLPADEEKLFEYATSRLNRRQWRDADRAFQAYLERHPEGQRAEQVHYHLGQLHVSYAQRYEAGREWLGKFCSRYPKSTWYWHARFLIAQSFQTQNLKSRALEAYRALVKECPEENFRNSAAQTVFRLQNKYLRPYVNQSFTAGTNPQIRIGSRNINSAKLRLFRLAFADVVEHLRPGATSVPDAVKKVKRKELVKKWSEILWTLRGNWRNKNVTLPVTEAGIYLVEVEHDGITFSLTVLVNRYGLVTKQAAGEMIVFAQDRVTGAPAPGMRVRALHGDKVAEGVTSDAGLVKFYGVKEAALVLGAKDGEHAFNSTWVSGHGPKQSLFYVFTDRPIYRPDQRVRFKVVHRVEEAGALTVQEGLKLKVTINDARGTKVHEGEYALNDFGSVHGEFRLGAEPTLGNYRIQVEPLGPTAPVQGWYWRRGLGNWGQFRVDEYRKPEFKVHVAFDRRRYIQGDTLKGKIRADYYFGSPVPNAPVTYKVFRRRHWTPYYRRHVWHDWYGEENSERWYGGHGQVVHQGQGRTDAQGRLAISHAIPREDHDTVYTVVAQVTDLGRRKIDGAASVLATQAEFGLAIQLDRYVVRPKEPFQLTLRVATHDGDPVADQAVRLKILHRRWDGKDYEEREIFRAAELRTTAQGEITTPLTIPQSGYMRLEASAQDARGNTVKISRYLWIASPNWGGGYMNWQGVDIVADKESYEPGDTATFLVTSQVKDLALLFSLESDRIHHYQVIRLNGHTATVQIPLDKPSYIPNVYVAAMALHGGQAYQRQKSVQVNPSARFLTVEIEPEKKTYRPREKARFKITTRDRDGQPVAAEVALGVVDESLYALQPEFAADMRQFFVRRKRNLVQSRSSLQFWDHGRAEAKEEGIVADAEAVAPGMRRAKGKKRAAQTAYAATEIRARFADTMLWSPTVVTDRNGEATVTLDQVADNLTTWRLTARGMGRQGLVGQAKNSILVRKDVIVRLQTPRFFTQGDRSMVTAVIRNDLDQAKDVKVVVEAEGIEVAGERTLTVRVAAKGERRVDWTAYVGAPGKARITVQALTDEASDAMRLDIPVLPHGSLQWTSRAGLVEQRIQERIHLPADAIPETTELLIVVSPTHAATVLDALDYLAGYPYGCVEQTMSRFLPTAITRQVLQQLQIRKPELEEELPHMLRAGLQRLYNFQHYDGGWGWWKHDQSNPFITAYVVYGLSLAQKADVEVDANVLRRAVQALQGHLQKADDDETRAYLLYALSTAGVKAPAARNALADNLTKLPAATKAMVALVLHQDGEKREARRVLAALAKEAVEVGAGAHWKGQNKYRWTSHSVETTALGLQALLAIDPDHALVKKVVTWLAMTRDGDHWVSTRQTAMVVYALAGYLARTGEREPDMTLTLQVNGTRLFEKRVTKDNWHEFDGTVKLTGAQLRPGANMIVLDKQGTGTPVYALYLKHFVRADKFQPSQGGVRIERSYTRVTQVAGKPKQVPLADGAVVKSGDEIQVTLKVLADRPHRYLIIEDPMPAGFEAVREPRPQWYG
ncbi:MAG: MG2 domain-containing protein, partial [Planctomycetota bacterium]